MIVSISAIGWQWLKYVLSDPIALVCIYLASWLPSVLSNNLLLGLTGNPYRASQGLILEVVLIVIAWQVVRRVPKWLTYASYISFILAILGCAQWLGYNGPMPVAEKYYVHGLFGNAGYFASYMVVSIAIAMHCKQYKLIPVLAVSMVLTGERAAIVETAGMYCAYLAYEHRGKYLALLIVPFVLLGIVLAVFHHGYNDTGRIADTSLVRLYAWESVLPYIEQKPIIGWGPDSMRLYVKPNERWKSEEGGNTLIDPSHNMIIDILFYRGIVGLIGLIPLAYLAFRNWRPWLLITLIIHCIDSLVNVQTRTTELLGWLILFSN